jgi:hypothetical protein
MQLPIFATALSITLPPFSNCSSIDEACLAANATFPFFGIQRKNGSWPVTYQIPLLA